MNQVFGGYLPEGSVVSVFAPKSAVITPKPLRAVRLQRDNLARVVWEMLDHGVSYTIHVDACRDSINVGTKRFDTGEWIVAENDFRCNGDQYRHPTQEETELYGLV